MEWVFSIKRVSQNLLSCFENLVRMKPEVQNIYPVSYVMTPQGHDPMNPYQLPCFQTLPAL